MPSQSGPAVQPQAPLTQALSLAALVQSTQAAPHDAASVLSTQVPGAPLQQKPLAQSPLVVQLAAVGEGVCVAVGVSVAVLVIVELAVAVAVLVGVAGGGTEGRARTMELTNVSIVL